MWRKKVFLIVISLLIISFISSANSYTSANINNKAAITVTKGEDSLIAVPESIVVNIKMTKTTTDNYEVVGTRVDQAGNTVNMTEYAGSDTDTVIEIASNFKVDNNTSNNVILRSIEFYNDNDVLKDYYNLYEPINNLGLKIEHALEGKESDYDNDTLINGNTLLKLTWDGGEAEIITDLKVHVKIINKTNTVTINSI